MSIIDCNKLFESKYNQEDGNLFSALNNYINDSDNLCKSYQNRISDSEALSSILTDKLPENINNRKLIQDAEIEYLDLYIGQILADIDDVEIRNCVYNSICESRFSNNLTYIYDNGISEEQKSRIRILCNMLWNSIFVERKE